MQKESKYIKNVTKIAFFAALVIALNIINPLNYGVYSFRLSTALRSLFIFDPIVSFGFALGNFINNVMAGKIYPLFWLIPFLNIPVAYVARAIKIRYGDILALLFINTVMSVFIGINYWLLTSIPLWINFTSKFVADGIVMALGYFVAKAIYRR